MTKVDLGDVYNEMAEEEEVNDLETPKFVPATADESVPEEKKDWRSDVLADDTLWPSN